MVGAAAPASGAWQGAGGNDGSGLAWCGLRWVSFELYKQPTQAIGPASEQGILEQANSVCSARDNRSPCVRCT
jgi:hypothetical protein